MNENKKTRVIGIRVPEEEYKKLYIRAFRKDMSVTEYVKWVLFRKHKGERG